MIRRLLCVWSVFLLLLLPGCQYLGPENGADRPLVTAEGAVEAPTAGAGLRVAEAPVGQIQRVLSYGILVDVWARQGIVSLSEEDKAEMSRAEGRVFTAPVGQKVTWHAPAGDSGSVTPLRDAYATDGAYCREFELALVLAGATHQAKTLLCQTVNGTWRLAR